MAVFVLVHGAWHGGWCWRKVSPLLRRAGAAVYAPTLSGLGGRAHLRSRLPTAAFDLDLHIADIVGLLEAEELEQVTLVGHAYAGMVISGAAELCPQRLAHLVYLNGVVPQSGESMADQLTAVRGPEFAAWVRRHIAAAEGGVAGDGDAGDAAGGLAGDADAGDADGGMAGNAGDAAGNMAIADAGWLPPPSSPEEIGRRWGIDDAADREWMFRRVTAQPAAAMAAPVRLGNPAAAAIPRSFILGAEAGFEPVARRAEQAGWGLYRVASGHDTMVSHPRELAEILLGIASAF